MLKENAIEIHEPRGIEVLEKFWAHIWEKAEVLQRENRVHKTNRERMKINKRPLRNGWKHRWLKQHLP